METPVPEGSILYLRLAIPGTDEKIKIGCSVVESVTGKASRHGVRAALADHDGRVASALERLLLQFPNYRHILGTSPGEPEVRGVSSRHKGAEEPSKTTAEEKGSGDNMESAHSLSVSWLRDAVFQPEMELSETKQVEKPAVTTAPVREKTRLTAEERAIAEPVGEFIRNLTKAMLKSGYYSADHPEAGSAKQGLYEAFKRVMRNIPELTITNREARDQSDLLVTGVLDDPVSLEVVVGSNTAELFVPKLQEFCRRKGLVSFSINRNIPPEHFELFIDIMSDPVVDRSRDKKAGSLLTRALVDNGITDVSTVFVDDMIELERNLPWRVEMAICRLTKDLRVMPMFRGVDNEQLKELKRNIVADIIRPLRHPRLLNDLLVNCYIISRYVKNVPREEIERDIVEAFPVDMLLPTVEFTFRELERLMQKKEQHPDNTSLVSRIMGIKRMLSLIAERVIPLGTAESHAFLKALYEKQILGFKDLPANIQYAIKTRLMVEDVMENIGGYVNGLVNAGTAEDAAVYLKCFRRVAGSLVEQQAWSTLLAITDAVGRAMARDDFPATATAQILRSGKAEIVRDKETHVLFLAAGEKDVPLFYIFKDSTPQIVMEYARMVTGPDRLKKERNDMDSFITRLGQLGVVALFRVMDMEGNHAARKAALELAAGMEEWSVPWARARLSGGGDLPDEECRAPLSVIARTGRNADDFTEARNFLKHPNPRLRQLALEAVYTTQPPDRETILVDALNDRDKEVRDTAGRLLAHVCPLSGKTMTFIVDEIASDPEPGDDPDAHVEKVLRLISAVKKMKQITDKDAVELRLIELAKTHAKKLSSWKNIFSRKERWRARVFEEIIGLLGMIGGQNSEAFLEEMINKSSDVSHGELALEAFKQVVEREGKKEDKRR